MVRVAGWRTELLRGAGSPDCAINDVVRVAMHGVGRPFPPLAGMRLLVAEPQRARVFPQPCQ